MNENWCALCISILKNVTPEMAFEILDTAGTKSSKPMKYRKNKALTMDDVVDMVRLKANHSYRELGEMYGMSPGAVYCRIKNYEKKNIKSLN